MNVNDRWALPATRAGNRMGPIKKWKSQIAKSSFTEALLLGPRLESAPPRISNRVQFQGGRRRENELGGIFDWENEIWSHHFSRGSKTRLFTQLQHLVNRIKAGILGGQLLRAPNSQRPPRATKARWLAIFGKDPPTPSGTEHWILGHQGLQPRALTKIYVWASRRGMPLIVWCVSPPATNRNVCSFSIYEDSSNNERKEM